MGDNKFYKVPPGTSPYFFDSIKKTPCHSKADRKSSIQCNRFFVFKCCLIRRTVQHLTGGSLQDADQIYLSVCNFTTGGNYQTGHGTIWHPIHEERCPSQEPSSIVSLFSRQHLKYMIRTETWIKQSKKRNHWFRAELFPFLCEQNS